MSRKTIPVDYTIDRIINEIQKEMESQGVDLDYDTILELVSYQFYSVKVAIQNGESIFLTRFGAFRPIKKFRPYFEREMSEEKNIFTKELRDNRVVTGFKFRLKPSTYIRYDGNWYDPKNLDQYTDMPEGVKEAVLKRYNQQLNENLHS